MRRPNWISASEQAYIDASRRSAWWRVALRRSAVVGLVLLTVLAAVFGFVAEEQRKESDKQRQFAEEQRIEADRQRQFVEEQRIEADKQRQFALARQLVAHAERVSHQWANLLPVSVLLAIEALQRLSSLETDQALRNGLTLLPHLPHSLRHADTVWAVSFSPDGRLVVSGSWDNTVRMHRWRPEDLIAEACSRLTRNLTKGEWQLFLGDEPSQKTCKNLPEEKY